MTERNLAVIGMEVVTEQWSQCPGTCKRFVCRNTVDMYSNHTARYCKLQVAILMWNTSRPFRVAQSLCLWYQLNGNSHRDAVVDLQIGVSPYQRVVRTRVGLIMLAVCSYWAWFCICHRVANLEVGIESLRDKNCLSIILTLGG